MQNRDAEEVLKNAVRKGLLMMWQEENEDHERHEGEYYPSSIGSCIRKQYYEYTKPMPPSPETLAIFATGEGVHEAVAESLKRSGEVIVNHTELPIKLRITEEIELSGRVDILLAEILGKKAVVEVKSTSSIPSEPYESHMLQLQTYLHALAIDTGFMLYWDKRTGNIESFMVKRDDIWLRRAGERVVILHEHIKKKAPPIKEAFEEGRYWECDQCAYLDDCEPFSLLGVAKGSNIAVYGIAFQNGVIIPEIKNISAKIINSKSQDNTVIILCDTDLQASNVAVHLKNENIKYDLLYTKPQRFRSGIAWKLELIKRLSERYRIRYFADSSQKVLELARPFVISSEAV
ncbi:MAG: PD-(D/E)XK nuclease family protein [Conexivisphaerales archaeon]